MEAPVLAAGTQCSVARTKIPVKTKALSTIDSEEVKQLGDELGRFVFGK
jgi:hypothetical protein